MPDQPHMYLSTACHHGDHAYCGSAVGRGTRGETWVKTPGVCKFCESPCICACHGGAQ